MRTSLKHARRRAVVLAFPSAVAGGFVYAPNALAANGGTFLGAALMIGAAVFGVLDLGHAEQAEREARAAGGAL